MNELRLFSNWFSWKGNYSSSHAIGTITPERRLDPMNLYINSRFNTSPPSRPRQLSRFRALWRSEPPRQRPPCTAANGWVIITRTRNHERTICQHHTGMECNQIGLEKTARTRSVASSSSLRRRAHLTRTLYGTLRMPLCQTYLLRPGSTRTSLVPIIRRANFLISWIARGAFLLKPLHVGKDQLAVQLIGLLLGYWFDGGMQAWTMNMECLSNLANNKTPRKCSAQREKQKRKHVLQRIHQFTYTPCNLLWRLIVKSRVTVDSFLFSAISFKIKMAHNLEDAKN